MRRRAEETCGNKNNDQLEFVAVCVFMTFPWKGKSGCRVVHHRNQFIISGHKPAGRPDRLYDTVACSHFSTIKEETEGEKSTASTGMKEYVFF